MVPVTAITWGMALQIYKAVDRMRTLSVRSIRSGALGYGTPRALIPQLWMIC